MCLGPKCGSLALVIDVVLATLTVNADETHSAQLLLSPAVC